MGSEGNLAHFPGPDRPILHQGRWGPLEVRADDVEIHRQNHLEIRLQGSLLLLLRQEILLHVEIDPGVRGKEVEG